MINFTKMVGAGNDFIVIEAQKKLNYKKIAQKICNRSNGVGADGLLILDKSKQANYRMRIINPDGSEAEMCGNGARCMAAYIAKFKNTKKEIFSIETLAGTIFAEAQKETANIRLSDPKNYKESLPLKINNRKLETSYIDTGVPHTVVFVSGLKCINVKKIGSLIRHNAAFKPRGTNVNFVEQINKSLVNARTYERGVEDETKACGTGSVASAIVAFIKANPNISNKKSATMKVRTASNEILKIKFDIKNRVPSNVWLSGSAKFIAKGEYYN